MSGIVLNRLISVDEHAGNVHFIANELESLCIALADNTRLYKRA